MNNTLKYKLDTAGIVAFVIGVSISVIVGRLFFFGTNVNEVARLIFIEVIVNICATLFGAISGALAGFLGVICSMAICGQDIMFSDAVALAAIGTFIGIFAWKYGVREGNVGRTNLLLWSLMNALSLLVSFVFIKPFADFLVYDKNLFSGLDMGFRVLLICVFPVGIGLAIFFVLVSKFIQNVKK